MLDADSGSSKKAKAIFVGKDTTPSLPCWLLSVPTVVFCRIWKFFKLARVCYWPYSGINPMFTAPVRRKSNDFLSRDPLPIKLSLRLLEVCLGAVSLWWPCHCSPACEHPVHVQECHWDLPQPQEQKLLTAGLIPALKAEFLVNGVKFQFHRVRLGAWIDFGDFESCYQYCQTSKAVLSLLKWLFRHPSQMMGSYKKTR